MWLTFSVYWTVVIVLVLKAELEAVRTQLAAKVMEKEFPLFSSSQGECVQKIGDSFPTKHHYSLIFIFDGCMTDG